MTAKEIQKRNEKSQHLRVVQVDSNNFYVESSEGKICYRVSFENEKQTCTCGDFARGVKGDVNFRCKHIVSVYSSIPNGEVRNGKVLERTKPKLDERWITTIEGREFVKYPGLLDLGHQKGISQIEVDIVQLPCAENGQFAVCKASVVSKSGESFVDIGDANPGNCSSKVSKHILRMASTRAIARALRSFTNIGMTCLEEVDFSDLSGNSFDATRPRISKQSDKRPRGNPIPKVPDETTPAPASTEPNTGNGGNGAKASRKPTEPTQQQPNPEQTKTQSPSVPTMSEAQKRAIYNLSRRRGISVEDLGKMALESYGVELGVLSSKDASSFIRNLQQAA
jgi:hypothetical protein